LYACGNFFLLPRFWTKIFILQEALVKNASTTMKNFALLFLLFSFFPQAGWGETIILAADEWPPYNIQPGKQPEGYMVDIAREVFKSHNIEVVYKVVPWTRALEGTKTGKYTGAIGPSKNEAPGLIFPDEELTVNKLSFWIKKGNPWRFTGQNSVHQVSLALIQSYDYRSWLNTYAQTHKHDKNKIQFVTGEAPLAMNLRKLVAGRVGAVVDNEATVHYKAKQLELLDAIELAGKDTEPIAFYIAFSPATPRSVDYAKMLSDGIVAMRKSGRLQQILAVYDLSDWKE
jgi:polar amino acid transport system substrate-binding protein